MEALYDDFEEDWATILRKENDLKQQAASNYDRLAAFREAKKWRTHPRHAQGSKINHSASQSTRDNRCLPFQDQDLWLEHNQRWMKLESDSQLGPIGMADIPWPPSHDGIIAAYACSARAESQCALSTTSLEPAQLRSAFHRAQKRWHPDKFFHVFCERMRSSEAAEILDKVKVISQHINSEWEQMFETDKAH